MSSQLKACSSGLFYHLDAITSTLLAPQSAGTFVVTTSEDKTLKKDNWYINNVHKAEKWQ